MNNRIQQRFDKSIREALAATKRAADLKHANDCANPKELPRMSAEEKRSSRRKPRGRLYLDPLTGATVWEPNVGTCA